MGVLEILCHSSNIQKSRNDISWTYLITNQGKVRFQIYEEMMDAKGLIRFMKGLIKDAQRKVYVILDNLRVQHAKLVQA